MRRICDHYGVDARILLEPLEDLRAQGNKFSDLIFSLGTEDPQPVTHQTLPDGFYSEWKPSLHLPNAVNHHLFRISTVDGSRVSKVRCRNNVRGKIAGLKHHIHRIDYVGVLFKQHGGFAMFDMPVKGHSVLSLTVYRRGFHIYEDIFPGVKLSSISYSMNRSNSCVPCFMERVPPGWKNLMAAARTPYLQKTSEAPEHVGTVLRGIQDSGFTFIDAE